ncbi:MAG: TPM domain-containing protein [Nostocales cyanobacterium]|nr:MAG: TPM domain-containing protein [Nostocales cyanobacterium]TAF13047.1 MAG: TPM domain-containing protein [Nostocales cyanobacterium]
MKIRKIEVDKTPSHTSGLQLIKSKKLRQWGQLFLTSCLVFAAVLFTHPSHALSVVDIPNPRIQNGGWVTDMVDMLSPSAEKKLNQMISDLEKKNSAEIAVVTVPTTQPASTPKAFATELFNNWGIGKQETDNGVLFLVSQGDRRTEITTGYGIEGILTTEKIQQILTTLVTPEFKQGNFENGIIAGTEAIVKELDNIRIFPPKVEVYNNQESFTFIFLVGFLLIANIIYYFIFFRKNKNSRKYRSSSSSTDSSYSSSSSYGGDSGGSSFGGGDSGGGGGGDSW